MKVFGIIMDFTLRLFSQHFNFSLQPSNIRTNAAIAAGLTPSFARPTSPPPSAAAVATAATVAAAANITLAAISISISISVPISVPVPIVVLFLSLLFLRQQLCTLPLHITLALFLAVIVAVLITGTLLLERLAADFGRIAFSFPVRHPPFLFIAHVAVTSRSAA